MKKKPTKEEILEKYYGGQSISMEGRNHKRIWFDVALKAMQEYANLFHKEKLREELIKFQKWHEDKLFKCHALEMAVEHNVDEYLKTKE